MAEKSLLTVDVIVAIASVVPDHAPAEYSLPSKAVDLCHMQYIA